MRVGFKTLLGFIFKFRRKHFRVHQFLSKKLPTVLRAILHAPHYTYIFSEILHFQITSDPPSKRHILALLRLLYFSLVFQYEK